MWVFKVYGWKTHTKQTNTICAWAWKKQKKFAYIRASAYHGYGQQTKDKFEADIINIWSDFLFMKYEKYQAEMLWVLFICIDGLSFPFEMGT